MAISVGSVEVDVIPNTRGIYARLRQGLVQAGTRAGEDAGEAAGRSFGPAMQARLVGAGQEIGEQIGREVSRRVQATVAEGLRDGVRAGGRQSRPAATREGNESGGAFARAARARIEAAFRSIPDITIGADTSEADSDLQALRARMQALSSRTIGVDLDAGEARAELQALEAELRRVGAAHPNPTVRADTASARTELAALRTQLEAMEADPTRIRVETDGTFGQRLRAQVQAAEASLPNINIGADTTPAQAELASLRAQLTALRDVRVGVDIDAATAQAQISDIQARLQALSASDADVAVRVDAGAAASQLAGVQAMVSALDGQTAKINVDTSGALSAIFQLSVAIAGVAAIPAVPVAAAGIGSLASAATAAGAGVGAFAAAAIPALSGIKSALEAQKAAQQAATTASAQGGQQAAQAARQALQQAGAQQQLATAHRNAARQIAQAQQGVRDAQTNGARQITQARQAITEAHRNGARQVAQAEQAVGDAVRNAARANQSAAEQVRTARQGLSSAYEQAVDRMRAANERVQQAEQSLADAQRTARQAQQDLTQARRDAKAELQDLNNRLASAQLSERDAALSVQEALARLRAVQAKGSKASLLEQQRAQLAYDQAVQRLKEQRLETGRLASEKKVADRTGVDGTDRVKSAQERLVQAQRGVASQEAALSRARQDMGRQQVQNSRDIANAQLRVAQAQRNVATTQEDGARSIARARAAVGVAEQQAAASVAKARQQLAVAEQTSAANVRRAQQQVSAARQSAADSIASAERQVRSAQLSSAGGANAAATAQAKYAAALAKLSPAARETFNAFLSLRTAFDAWSRSLQPAIMPIFTRALNGLKNALPGLTPFVLAAARAITVLQNRVSQGFKSPWWKSFKTDLAASVQPAMVGLGIAFGNVFKGMVGVIHAFLPHMDSISGRMQTLTARFANWGTGLKGSPAFERFLSYASSMGPQVAQTIGKIGAAFWEVTRALEPLSGPLLVVLGLLADGIASVAQNFPGLIQLFWTALVVSRLYRLSLIAGAAAMVVYRGAMVLATLMTHGWTAAVIAANAAFAANPVVVIVLAILAALALLVAGVIYAWNHWRWFRTIVVGAWNAIKTAAVWVWNVVLKPIFSAIWAGLRAVGNAALWLYHNAIAPAWTGIKWLISLYWNYWLKPIFTAIRWYFRMLGSVAMWLWRNAVNPAFRGIAGAGSWLWNKVLQPVFSAIRAGMRFVGRVAMWLWRNAIGPSFRLMAAGGKWLLKIIAVLVVGPIVIAFRLLGWVVKQTWKYLIAPAFRAIAAGGRWLWQKVLKPNWNATKEGLRLLGAAFRWLNSKVFGPAWRGIAATGRWLWNKVLKPNWNYTKAGLRALASAFRWLNTKVVKPAWSGIRWSISNQWNKGIRPAFGALRNGVWNVASSFRKAKDAMGRAWDQIREKTRKPVKWVVDKVYNYGIRALWNNARKVLPGLDYLKWQKFRTGGAVYGPGTATSDSIPARLSAGEHVWTAKEVAGAGGHAGVEALRAAARGGAGRSGPAAAAGGVPGFARGGGIGDWITKGAGALNRLNMRIGAGVAKAGGWAFGSHLRNIRDAALGGVSKLANFAAKPIRALIDKIPGASGGWGQMVRAVPRGILNAALSAITSSESGAMGGGSPGVARALKWVKGQAGKPYQWGGAYNPSFDCSGLLSSVQKVIQGRNPKGRLWSTFSFQGRRAPAGWKYHAESPYKIGITNQGKGHTAGTLAGTKIESRGGDGVVVGSRARGFNNPMFGKNWYGFLPARGSGSVSGVAGAKAAARQMLGEYGWSQKQWPPLDKLWTKESGWRWNARNPSSGAYGIVQALPPEKMRSAGADWKTNPTTQIKWGLKYIKGRYGSPAAAWAHSQRVNWYDQGGYLPPGLSTVYNGTGAPEPVLTSQQMRALQGAAVRGGDGASGGEFTGGLYLDSGEFLGAVRGVVRTEQSAQQRAMTNRFRAGR